MSTGSLSEKPRERQYKPKTKTQTDLADYYEVKDGDQLQNGFVLLAPGATIAVKPLWLHATLASVSKKKRKNNKETKSAEVIKKLIDGFFEPWDLAIKGGTKAFSENPIFKSLRCYAEHKLNMDHAMFNRFWSEKMSSAKLTVKRLKEARK